MNNKDPYIEPLSAQEAEEDWLAIIARIRAHEAKKRRRKITRLTSAIAASILLLIGTIFTYRMYVLPDVYYAKDKDLVITLKDSSQITLSKGAKLTVDKSFPSNTRDVFLEGNAIFKVTKSKEHPFIVHGNGYRTKVLGTVFKITQTEKTFNVDLYEGKVQVAKNEKPTEVFVLHPKETFSNMGSPKVVIISATNKQKPEVTNATATLLFTNLPLSEAVTIVEKTYRVKVNYPVDQATAVISVNMENATVDNMVNFIAAQLDLNSKKNNDKTFELEE
ncbi:ferric-dicitrate binding protein FerR (iron transport regulator) [Chryseobacterium rhizosphaerae]|uniref:FecR family protein n=1 Tax=Chryseobacterium rhizosphaerae TaxID=395937 RepID=UPI00285C707D|nr:FecR family protein [Chryseobacterium rhizosphaerae]MDR6546509.1 ferric-dicitrate binding protein FerR (iron transport regulator) [Chryseobacterium rhizosphaerae]